MLVRCVVRCNLGISVEVRVMLKYSAYLLDSLTKYCPLVPSLKYPDCLCVGMFQKVSVLEAVCEQNVSRPEKFHKY
jgi:hypothetical protein